ncbi:hypothetical protein H8356DRAFT_991449 [Neocallimastix lanati (nom. inval.)]|nr:hypothetical protein H8356DRAFT_991449 [Neocallimastix sp. JGI-2020a]
MKYIIEVLLLSFSLLISSTKGTTPVCSDCVVYSTGKDGSLWGRENGDYCKLSSKCVDEAKTSRKVIAISKSTIVNKKKKDTKKKTTTTKITKTKTTKTTKPATTSSTYVNGTLICNGCEVTATGGQESLWGWENEKSCLIDYEKCNIKAPEVDVEKNKKIAEANHKKNSSDYLVCNGCTITDIGEDGSYWGWEDNYSCQIDNILCNYNAKEATKTTTPPLRGSDGTLICNTCKYTSIDNSLVAWNTENGEKCRVLGSRCNFNSSPHPWCSGCTPTDYTSYGEPFGWENQNSCLINEVKCGIIKYEDGNDLQKVSAAASKVKFYYIYYLIAFLSVIFII